MIQLAKVSLEYKKGVKALNKIDLALEQGEFVSIVGPNGSGKSTFAKILNGLLFPSTGVVTIDGLQISDDVLWDIRQKVGMVFQNPEDQIVASTVEDDVAFGLENLGYSADIIKERISIALELVGLAGFEKALTSHLSGGQKQRLAIAGVLAINPKIIVFDEATSMLDPIGRKQFFAIIKKLREQGRTIIQVTHAIDEALSADRLVVLNSGEIVIDEFVKEFYPKSYLLNNWGLEAPFVVDLANRLVKHGWQIQPNIESTEDLVNEICKYLSKT